MRASTIFCLLLVALVNSARGADKQETLAAWETLLGKWEASNGDQKVSYSVRKASSGVCFIHEGPNTMLSAWDSNESAVRVVGFAPNGTMILAFWKLAGSGPTFEGSDGGGGKMEMKFSDKDNYVMTSGSTKWTGKRMKRPEKPPEENAPSIPAIP